MSSDERTSIGLIAAVAIGRSDSKSDSKLDSNSDFVPIRSNKTFSAMLSRHKMASYPLRDSDREFSRKYEEFTQMKLSSLPESVAIFRLVRHVEHYAKFSISRIRWSEKVWEMNAPIGASYLSKSVQKEKLLSDIWIVKVWQVENSRKNIPTE